MLRLVLHPHQLPLQPFVLNPTAEQYRTLPLPLFFPSFPLVFFLLLFGERDEVGGHTGLVELGCDSFHLRFR